MVVFIITQHLWFKKYKRIIFIHILPFYLSINPQLTLTIQVTTNHPVRSTSSSFISLFLIHSKFINLYYIIPFHQIRDNKMSKTTFLVAFSMVVLSVVNSVSADTFPQWCLCGGTSQTRDVCERVYANWDGGSCGLDNQNVFNNFISTCKSQNRAPQCWH